MINIIEKILYAVFAVIFLSVLYHIIPFKKWNKNNKPKFVIFPKYAFQYSANFELLENKLLMLNFEKSITKQNLWYRGKIYGDFSANKVKVHLLINRENNMVKLYAPYICILFDTGDLWKLVKELIEHD